MGSKIKKIIIMTFHIMFLMLLALLLVASFFSKIEFANETIEEYYFYTGNGIGNSDSSVFNYAMGNYVIPYIIISFIFVLLFYNIPIKIKNKEIDLLRFFRFHRKSLTLVLTIIVGFISLCNVSFFSYVYNNIATTNVYDNEYVQGSKDLVDFDSKKNLVMIYIESLETTFMDKKSGGDWDYNIIPELTELLDDKDSIYFASDDSKQGVLNLYGTHWTTASVISNSSGMPFKVPMTKNYYNNTNFLNSVYTIGDLLKDNGYHNEVISGAPTTFGGLNPFFKIHGDYEIIDTTTFKNYSYKVTSETKGSWGFNDKYMFEIAKERILKHVNDGKLFNETLIGIDTHPMDGYKTNYTVNNFDTQYENVYKTDSELIVEFVNWLKGHDFYKDTTIVITGDHLCMQTNFMGDHENRGRYNVIINPSAATSNTKNRVFTSIDMYPTVVAALGGKIKDDQIGLGVNLFSNKKTLSEKYELDNFDKELMKKSNLYSKIIRGE